MATSDPSVPNRPGVSTFPKESDAVFGSPNYLITIWPASRPTIASTNDIRRTHPITVRTVPPSVARPRAHSQSACDQKLDI